MPGRTGIVADEAIGNFRRGVMLRYVMREPNSRVRRSCTSLGNLEVFLFVSFVLKDYVLGWTLLFYCMIGQTSRDGPAFCSCALEYRTMTHV
jgi:hypothetical protein